MKKYRHICRGFSFLLVFIFFLNNCLLAHAPEANFWAERRAKNNQFAMNAGAPLSPASAALPGRAGLDNLKSIPITAPLEFSGKNPPSRFGLSRDSGLETIVSSIPQQFGTVRKVALGRSGNENPIVIHIQDVHQNPEAQRNIGEVLQNLISKGKIDLVCLEGAFHPVDLSEFREPSLREPITKAADYFLRINKISGSIYSLLTAPGPIPAVIGVDDLNHYRGNVKAFQESARLVKSRKSELAVSKRNLEKEKASILNPRLQAFDQKVEAYRRGEIQLGDYAKFLKAQSQKVEGGNDGIREGNSSNGFQALDEFLEALALETSLNFGQVEAERTSLLSQVVGKLDQAHVSSLVNETAAYRLGRVSHGQFYGYLADLCRGCGIELRRYKSMEAYLRYVLLSENIDGGKLFREIQNLERNVFEGLIRSKEERDLIRFSRELYLQGQLLDFALTPEEWSEYKTLRHSRGSGNPWTVSRNGPVDYFDYRNGIPASAGMTGFRGDDVSLSSFESFYLEAEARDQLMARNLLMAMGQKKVRVTVLVTGGFHSEGIARSLEEAGITTVTFVPKITKANAAGGSQYLSVFTQEKTPLEKVFEGEKLYLSPPNWTAAFRAELRVVTAAVGRYLNPRTVLRAPVRFAVKIGNFVFCVLIAPVKGVVLVWVRFGGPELIQSVDQWFLFNPARILWVFGILSSIGGICVNHPVIWGGGLTFVLAGWFFSFPSKIPARELAGGPSSLRFHGEGVREKSRAVYMATANGNPPSSAGSPSKFAAKQKERMDLLTPLIDQYLDLSKGVRDLIQRKKKNIEVEVELNPKIRLLKNIQAKLERDLGQAIEAHREAVKQQIHVDPKPLTTQLARLGLKLDLRADLKNLNNLNEEAEQVSKEDVLKYLLKMEGTYLTRTDEEGNLSFPLDEGFVLQAYPNHLFKVEALFQGSQFVLQVRPLGEKEPVLFQYFWDFNRKMFCVGFSEIEGLFLGAPDLEFKGPAPVAKGKIQIPDDSYRAQFEEKYTQWVQPFAPPAGKAHVPHPFLSVYDGRAKKTEERDLKVLEDESKRLFDIVEEAQQLWVCSMESTARFVDKVAQALEPYGIPLRGKKLNQFHRVLGILRTQPDSRDLWEKAEKVPFLVETSRDGTIEISPGEIRNLGSTCRVFSLKIVRLMGRAELQFWTVGKKVALFGEILVDISKDKKNLIFGPFVPFQPKPVLREFAPPPSEPEGTGSLSAAPPQGTPPATPQRRHRAKSQKGRLDISDEEWFARFALNLKRYEAHLKAVVQPEGPAGQLKDEDSENLGSAAVDSLMKKYFFTLRPDVRETFPKTMKLLSDWGIPVTVRSLRYLVTTFQSPLDSISKISKVVFFAKLSAKGKIPRPFAGPLTDFEYIPFGLVVIWVEKRPTGDSIEVIAVGPKPQKSLGQFFFPRGERSETSPTLSPTGTQPSASPRPAKVSRPRGRPKGKGKKETPPASQEVIVKEPKIGPPVTDEDWARRFTEILKNYGSSLEAAREGGGQLSKQGEKASWIMNSLLGYHIFPVRPDFPITMKLLGDFGIPPDSRPVRYLINSLRAKPSPELGSPEGNFFARLTPSGKIPQTQHRGIPFEFEYLPFALVAISVRKKEGGTYLEITAVGPKPEVIARFFHSEGEKAFRKLEEGEAELEEGEAAGPKASPAPKPAGVLFKFEDWEKAAGLLNRMSYLFRQGEELFKLGGEPLPFVGLRKIFELKISQMQALIEGARKKNEITRETLNLLASKLASMGGYLKALPGPDRSEGYWFRWARKVVSPRQKGKVQTEGKNIAYFKRHIASLVLRSEDLRSFRFFLGNFGRWFLHLSKDLKEFLGEVGTRSPSPPGNGLSMGMIVPLIGISFWKGAGIPGWIVSLPLFVLLAWANSRKVISQAKGAFSWGYHFAWDAFAEWFLFLPVTFLSLIGIWAGFYLGANGWLAFTSLLAFLLDFYLRPLYKKVFLAWHGKEAFLAVQNVYEEAGGRIDFITYKKELGKWFEGLGKGTGVVLYSTFLIFFSLALFRLDLIPALRAGFTGAIALAFLFNIQNHLSDDYLFFVKKRIDLVPVGASHSRKRREEPPLRGEQEPFEPIKNLGEPFYSLSNFKLFWDTEGVKGNNAGRKGEYPCFEKFFPEVFDPREKLPEEAILKGIPGQIIRTWEPGSMGSYYSKARQTRFGILGFVRKLPLSYRASLLKLAIHSLGESGEIILKEGADITLESVLREIEAEFEDLDIRIPMVSHSRPMDLESAQEVTNRFLHFLLAINKVLPLIKNPDDRASLIKMVGRLLNRRPLLVFKDRSNGEKFISNLFQDFFSHLEEGEKGFLVHRLFRMADSFGVDYDDLSINPTGDDRDIVVEGDVEGPEILELRTISALSKILKKVAPTFSEPFLWFNCELRARGDRMGLLLSGVEERILESAFTGGRDYTGRFRWDESVAKKAQQWTESPRKAVEKINEIVRLAELVLEARDQGLMETSWVDDEFVESELDWDMWKEPIAMALKVFSESLPMYLTKRKLEGHQSLRPELEEIVDGLMDEDRIEAANQSETGQALNEFCEKLNAQFVSKYFPSGESLYSDWVRMVSKKGVQTGEFSNDFEVDVTGILDNRESNSGRNWAQSDEIGWGEENSWREASDNQDEDYWQEDGRGINWSDVVQKVVVAAVFKNGTRFLAPLVENYLVKDRWPRNFRFGFSALPSGQYQLEFYTFDELSRGEVAKKKFKISGQKPPPSSLWFTLTRKKGRGLAGMFLEALAANSLVFILNQTTFLYFLLFYFVLVHVVAERFFSPHPSPPLWLSIISHLSVVSVFYFGYPLIAGLSWLAYLPALIYFGWDISLMFWSELKIFCKDRPQLAPKEKEGDSNQIPALSQPNRDTPVWGGKIEIPSQMMVLPAETAYSISYGEQHLGVMEKILPAGETWDNARLNALYTILDELITNAIDAIREGKAITQEEAAGMVRILAGTRDDDSGRHTVLVIENPGEINLEKVKGQLPDVHQLLLELREDLLRGEREEVLIGHPEGIHEEMRAIDEALKEVDEIMAKPRLSIEDFKRLIVLRRFTTKEKTRQSVPPAPPEGPPNLEGGVGVGLDLVLSFAQEHGMRLDMESLSGKTRFIIEIPEPGPQESGQDYGVKLDPVEINTGAKAVGPGLEVRRYVYERPAEGGRPAAHFVVENLLVDLNLLAPILGNVEAMRKRDITGQWFVPNDPDTGVTIREWAKEYLKKTGLNPDLAFAVTLGGFVEANSFIVIDRKPFFKTPGARAIAQKEYAPPRGLYFGISLDPYRPGLFEFFIDDHRKIHGNLPRLGVGGQVLIRNWESRLDTLEFHSHPNIRGQQLLQEHPNMAFSLSAIGIQKGRLGIVNLYGKPDEGDSTIPDLIEVLLRLKFYSAILGPGSGEVQRYLGAEDAGKEIWYAESKKGSKIHPFLLAPQSDPEGTAWLPLLGHAKDAVGSGQRRVRTVVLLTRHPNPPEAEVKTADNRNLSFWNLESKKSAGGEAGVFAGVWLLISYLPLRLLGYPSLNRLESLKARRWLPVLGFLEAGLGILVWGLSGDLMLALKIFAGLNAGLHFLGGVFRRNLSDGSLQIHGWWEVRNWRGLIDYLTAQIVPNFIAISTGIIGICMASQYGWLAGILAGGLLHLISNHQSLREGEDLRIRRLGEAMIRAAEDYARGKREGNLPALLDHVVRMNLGRFLEEEGQEPIQISAGDEGRLMAYIRGRMDAKVGTGKIKFLDAYAVASRVAGMIGSSIKASDLLTVKNMGFVVRRREAPSIFDLARKWARLETHPGMILIVDENDRAFFLALKERIMNQEGRSMVRVDVQVQSGLLPEEGIADLDSLESALSALSEPEFGNTVFVWPRDLAFRSNPDNLPHTSRWRKLSFVWLEDLLSGAESMALMSFRFIIESARVLAHFA